MPVMSHHIPDFQDRWIQHQRRNHKTAQIWACTLCKERKICPTPDELWNHARLQHKDLLPKDDEELRAFRAKYVADSSQKSARTTKDDLESRKSPYMNAASSQPDPPPSKRPLSTSSLTPPARSLSGLQKLSLENKKETEDTTMRDASDNSDQPRKRPAVGDGISAGSASPFRERESESPPPRRSKARPSSGRYSDPPENQRPHVPRKQLWSPDNDAHIVRTSFDPINVASVQAQRARQQALQSKPRATFASPQQTRQQFGPTAYAQNSKAPTILGSKTATSLPNSRPAREETFEMELQPETRPISQEQLVAEVKGIYAGLVMVEAKCIEVDNKQAALAQADGIHSRLNNEQWQALIALHRTLLHEHHDFFLASQHPSASDALKNLASKYAMPARMWRHGIHSFLELLRHRLPASLDHMLAFIYLAYSMMALLYETVSAFEDTWIECLGDLGRYRMAIEDDDVRDREVWTGVARHWYSKASDKSPTTGRLYHHLAILARPNALQQLYYYSKSLCVVVPFTSARESVLTLFEPVINTESGHSQYRLPPLDTAFVRAHGLLFTNRDMDKFVPAVEDFLKLLDPQIGRVTRKFMEQGYYIAVSNCVAMLGFASKDNVLMRAASSSQSDGDVNMSEASANDLSLSMTSFKNAQLLTNATLKVVLQRIGDPNVLPFIHITLVFMLRMSRHPGAMSHLEIDFPWELLATMLNTLPATSGEPNHFEGTAFPIHDKDEARPFPEDFALRGLLWADNYFPENWFKNEQVDEEEKYHERASMTTQRRERILWLACQIVKGSSGLRYDASERLFYHKVEPMYTRASTFASEASATTTGTDRTETWPLDRRHDDHSDDDESTVAPSLTND